MRNVGERGGREKDNAVMAKRMDRFVEGTSGSTPYCSLVISSPSIPTVSPLRKLCHHLA